MHGLLKNTDNLKLGQQYIANEEVISPQSKNHAAIKRYALGFLKSYISVGIRKIK